VSEDADSGTDRGSGREQDRGRDLDTEHCARAQAWPEGLASEEQALLDAINLLRSRRIECGERDFEELDPLELSAALTCSARLHSFDMVTRDFVGRTNPDGDNPRDRMRAAGFDPDEWSESIVRSAAGPERALEELLEDWDDCMNVATRELTRVGIGHYGEVWTLDFARD